MDEREARFLMRQRGAGTRNVDDFSFTVGAGSDGMSTSDDGSRSNAPINDPIEKPVLQDRPSARPDTRANDNAAREERFQMRRRGAGTREQNVDFSLHLGAPVTSSPTTRTSDAGSTRSASSRQNVETGARRQGFVAASSPLRQNARQSLSRTTDVSGAASNVKRRRPSAYIEEEAADPEAEDADYFQDGGAEDLFEEDIPAATATIPVDSLQINSNGSVKKRRKKKSVLRKPKKRKTTNSASSVASSTNTEEDESGDMEETAQTDRQALAETGHVQQPVSATSRPGHDEATAEESVVQLNAGSANDSQATASSEQPKLYSISGRSDRPPTIPANPAVQRILNQHGMSNKENRPLQVRTKPTAATTKPAKSTSKKITRKRRERQSKERGATSLGLAENNNEVAITVHRVANISHLNFLSANDDELQAEQIPALKQKKAPNGIDVLAQICREIIDKRIKALATTQEAPNNSLKRQTESIRRFSDELDNRLLLMTTALDHSISLTQSLREATRQKTTHRTTLLTLRQRRHEIELQQDAVRATNESQSTLASEHFELNTLLADIKLAVQRGRDSTHSDAESAGLDSRAEADEGEDTLQESLSARVQRVSGLVSSADARLGLLTRVRAVNALLERLVA